MESINHYPLVKSFKPLEIFLIFFGYSYNINHCGKRVTTLQYIIQVIYLTFVIYLYINSQTEPAFRIFTSNSVLFIAYRIHGFIQIMCYILIFINNLSDKKYINSIFRKLNLVDSNFVLLKIYFDYDKNRRKLIFCVTLFTAMCVTMLAVTNLAFGSMAQYTWKTFAIFLNFFITPFTIYMKIMLYANLCWEIKVRLDQVNTFLGLEFEKNGQSKIKFTNILIISKLYGELSECIGLVNSGWSFTSLVFMGVPFIATTANLFLLFNFMAHTSDIDHVWNISHFYCLISWLVFFPLPIVIMSVVCNKTISASQQTSILFHKCITGNNLIARNEDIELISLQFHHQQFRFTAYGFFSIDNRLIFAVGSAITTYLVILLQFDAGTNVGLD